MKTSIIGSGYYGKAIANILFESGMNVTIWTEKENVEEVIVKDGIFVTNSFKKALDESDIVFILTGSKFVESVLVEIKKFIKPSTLIILGSKGLKDDGTLFTDIIKKMLPHNPYGVISGPTFAVDIASMEPVGFTVATDSKENFEKVKSALQNVSLEYSQDIDAIEMAGSLKNAYAIGSGILNGLNYGNSTRCLFITKVLKEMSTIFKSLGLNEYATLSLAGLGDLVMTCTSLNSRNFTFGTILALENDDEKREYLKNNTVEGYENLKAYTKMFEDKGINAPILDCIYRIVLSQTTVEELIKIMMK